MSSASRLKDASDYDLERFVEMFDQAMTSDDPRVKNALRQLMMMVILTDTGDHEANTKVKRDGPLRRMQDDMRNQYRCIQKLEEEIEQLKTQISYVASNYWSQSVEQASMLKQQGLQNISTSALQGLNIKIATDTGGNNA